MVALCQPKLSCSLREQALCIVSLIPILLCTPQKVTALLILSLLWSGQRGGVLLCFGRLGLWKQALLSHFGLDLKLTAHIQGVRRQREWNLRAMRSMAQISVPDHTSFHFPFAILPSRGASLES